MSNGWKDGPRRSLRGIIKFDTDVFADPPQVKRTRKKGKDWKHHPLGSFMTVGEHTGEVVGIGCGCRMVRFPGTLASVGSVGNGVLRVIRLR